MLKEWLTRLEPVHLTTTRSERETIYRFRYNVFVEELGREIGGVDHDHRWVRDDEDEKPYTMHAYTGSIDAITGSMRLRHWAPGAVPAYEQRLFSMNRVPGLPGFAIAELDRLMISRSQRGFLILPSMARTMYELLVGEKGTDLIFGCCGPGLVRHYRKIGMRPYRADPIPSPEGMRIPLMGISSDLDYAKSHGSVLVPLIKKHFGKGKRPPLDLEPFRELFEGDSLLVELDADRVWETMQEEILLEDKDLPSFLDLLPEKSVKKLAARGFVLDIPDGNLVTREGFTEKEMYVVLAGSFEIIAGGKRIALAHKGDLLGEVAFFRESGKRSASIRAVGDSQILLIRRRFVAELAREDPDAAFQILFNLGRILSERLVLRESGQ